MWMWWNSIRDRSSVSYWQSGNTQWYFMPQNYVQTSHHRGFLLYLLLMRYVIAICLLAISCFAQQQYGVMSVCTHVDGKEYCFLSPGEYRAVEMDGTMVVALGFNIQRYTPVTKETTITNGSGTTVRFWEADDGS